MSESSPRDFYDSLAPDYHLIYPDWDASVARQGRVLDGLIRRQMGAGPHRVLDCSCGIGTQAIGLALAGHTVVGSDLSPAAVRRAGVEAAACGVRVPVVAADMRRLPFAASTADVVISADNALPHLLSARDVTAALGAMRRVLRPGGLLVISIRAYEEALRTKPTTRPVQVTPTAAGKVLTFQLWHWHDDGVRYDYDLVQLIPAGDSWQVRSRRATYWALTREQVARFAADAGFTDVGWHDPAATGYHQPVLTARAPATS